MKCEKTVFSHPCPVNPLLPRSPYQAEMQDIRDRNDTAVECDDKYLKQIIATFPGAKRVVPAKSRRITYEYCRKLVLWGIGATPGALSQRLRDAAGAFTYIVVHSGRKLWIMREGNHIAPHRNDVVDLWDGDLL
jgi:hypothetical protein